MAARGSTNCARPRQDAARVRELQARRGPHSRAAKETQGGGRAARAARAEARVEARLRTRRATAPARGRRGHAVRVGERVVAGSPVVVLLPDGALKVRFFVPQARLSTAQGRRPRSPSPATAALRREATVSFVAPQAEFTPPVIYSTRTARSSCSWSKRGPPPTARQLHPGQPVDVRLMSAAADRAHDSAGIRHRRARPDQALRRQDRGRPRRHAGAREARSTASSAPTAAARRPRSACSADC